jgi:tetratricopeptide (TPR) repeat protein
MRNPFCIPPLPDSSRVTRTVLLCLTILFVNGCSDQKKQARQLLEQAVNRQEEKSHEDAIRILDRAIALDSSLGEAVFARGVSEMHLKNYDAAATQIRQALKINPDWPQAWWTLATVQRLQNHSEEALDALSRAVRLNPEFTEARYDRACLHQEAGRASAALTDLDQVLQWQPDDEDALLRRGILRGQVGDNESARRDLSNVIGLNRNCASAWFERAKIYSDESDSVRALADVTVACRISPDDSALRQFRAELLSTLGRHTEAGEEFCRLAKLQSSSPSPALLQAARAFESARNPELALNCLKPVFTNEPTEASTFALRARLREQTGDVAGETADLERSWALNPDDSKVGGRLVHGRVSEGRFTEALTLVTELLDSSEPQSAELVKLRATIFTRLNRTDDAIRDYTQLASFESHRSNALQERARLQIEARQWEEAAEDLTELLTTQPTNHKLLIQRAKVYEESGQPQPAIADLSQATKLRPNDPGILYQRACLEQTLGQTTIAEQHFLRVRELDPQHPGAMEHLARLSLENDDFAHVLKLLRQIPVGYSNAATLYFIRASASFAQHDLPTAIMDTSRALQIDAAHVASLLLRSRILLRLGKADEAMNNINQALKSSTPAAEMYELRGLAHQDQGHREEALHDYSLAIDLDPHVTTSRMARAVLRAAANDTPGTIEDAGAVLELEPNHREARQLRANAFFERYEFVAALKDLDALLETRTLFSENTDLLWKRSQCRMETGEIEGQYRDLSDILDETPGYLDARLARSHTLEQLGRLRESMDDLTMVLKDHPDHVEALNLRGTLQHRMGQFESAIVDLSQAVELEPQNARLRYQRGLAHVRLGDFTSARKDLDSALKLDDAPADYWYVRGNIFARSKKLQAAVDHYREAIVRNDQHSAAWYNCGNLLFEQKNYEDSIACWDKAIAIQPDLFRAWNNRAAALTQVDRSDEAVRNYERAIEINPDFARAYDNFAWLLATSEDTEIRDPERAVDMAAVACQLTGNQEWSFLSTLASCQAEAREFDKANAAAQAALNLAPASQRHDLIRLSKMYRSQASRQAGQARRRF